MAASIGCEIYDGGISKWLVYNKQATCVLGLYSLRIDGAKLPDGRFRQTGHKHKFEIEFLLAQETSQLRHQ
jgi:hypothetical protein